MAWGNQPPRGGPYTGLALSGCWVPSPGRSGHGASKEFLPLIDLSSHTTILSNSTRTVLRQTFKNGKSEILNEVQYTFPLFDGVSVVGFTCRLKSDTLVGVVKEKQQARVEYTKAVARGETAGLLEQLADASDVFTTKIGNIAPGEKVEIEITYLGELIHDSEVDGTKFVIPTAIAPRYGTLAFDAPQALASSNISANGISISIDVMLEEASTIRQIQSTSHALTVDLGRTHDMGEEVFKPNCASASLALSSTHLDKDFVFTLSSKEQGVPQALLETHPKIQNQRAIMTTLVPKFNLPNMVPEIVFVVDRSGSMDGKIDTLVTALRVFLKSLPVNGIKFNICSFGSHFSFLFEKSRTYDQTSLDEAMQHLDKFDSDFGGTEMLKPIEQTCQQRLKGMALAVMVLTDGQIWDQQALFNFINTQDNTRFFSLGIGAGASSALVDGIARAGRGFAQFVAEGENMDKKIVRMLKGALMPHVEYSLEVQYEDEEEEDFEVVEPVKSPAEAAEKIGTNKTPISLYNVDAKEEPTNPPAGRFDSLPKIATPKVIQAPHKVPALYNFDRTTAYLLLDPENRSKPKSVKLKGTSAQGPLELTVPVQDVGTGSMVHQLAAKKIVQELEQGRGWLTTATSDDGKLLKETYEGRWDLIVERECVRLGTRFGIAGKYTSFVAVKKRDGATDDEDGDQSTVVEEENMLRYSVQSPSSMLRARGAGLFGGRGGGSLFGSAPAPSGSGLFGAPAPPAASGGLHYASADLNKSTKTISLFGSQKTNNTYTFGSQSTSNGNPFGSQNTSSANLFGSQSTRSANPFGGESVAPSAFFGGSGKKGSAPGSGYGGGLVSYSSSSCSDMMPQHFQATNRAARRSVVSALSLHSARSSADNDDTVHDMSASPSEQLGVPNSDDQRMHQIIGLQLFEGNWRDEEKFWKLLDVEKQDLAKKCAGSADMDTALPTVAAIAWLQAKMQNEEEVWEMVVGKAKAWLAGLGKVDNVEEVLHEAKMLF